MNDRFRGGVLHRREARHDPDVLPMWMSLRQHQAGLSRAADLGAYRSEGPFATVAFSTVAVAVRTRRHAAKRPVIRVPCSERNKAYDRVAGQS